ncbi:MAG: ABC transporter ATP-binding protein [Chlamydiae bacterium RIFCSPLOWO2_01_FULL_28_7]|nr:MAG: ABC transporter ATP-binding protein [Chlamydiae bacterium RIFCSPLOWO2_01_FULL_28_7]
MIVLEAKNISKTFYGPSKIEILKDISLNLHKGESIAIMGNSGEGKTTLLHILGNLEEKDGGTLRILNNTKIDNKMLNKNIGFIFQFYNLLEDLTVLENVLMPYLIARKKLDNFKAEQLLEMVSLENRKNFFAKSLSGGEKQRVAIARAFCNNPEIILADEPSGNLDSKNSKQIHKLLLNSVKKLNKSLIVATHNRDLANLCDKVYLLKDGFLSNFSKTSGNLINIF